MKTLLRLEITHIPRTHRFRVDAGRLFVHDDGLPDAWIDPAKTQIGYEISFTRYFYKPVPMRSLEEIRADILALERETDGLVMEIVG